MTDSRTARASVQVALDNESASDSRTARASVQVALDNVNASDARVARASIQVAIPYVVPEPVGGGWGTVHVGV